MAENAYQTFGYLLVKTKHDDDENELMFNDRANSISIVNRVNEL